MNKIIFLFLKSVPLLLSASYLCYTRGTNTPSQNVGGISASEDVSAVSSELLQTIFMLPNFVTREKKMFGQ